MRFLSHVPIGLRLAAAFAALVALLGLAIGFALNQTDRIGRSSRALANQSLQTVVLAQEARGAAQAGATHLHSLFLLSQRVDRVPVYAQIDRSAAVRDQAIASLLAAAPDAETAPLLAEVGRRRDVFVASFSRTVDAVELDNAEARRVMQDETLPALRAMADALDDLVALQSRQADEMIRGIDTLQADSQRSILWLGLASVLVAFVSAVAITRSIAGPLAETAGLAREIAAGNLSSPLPAAGRDEVGALIHALDGMRNGIAQREHRIVELAYRDPLTGLPNRTLFTDRLRAAVADAIASGRPLAVLVLDLDRFKRVNDLLGHPVGDRLLVEVARRLQAAVAAELPGTADGVARIGGDEFALLLPDAGPARAAALATALRSALETPIDLQGQAVDVSGSLGIACCPEHGRDAAELMSRADIAMYVAKEGGQGQAVFNAAFERSGAHGLSLLSDLRRALEDGELLLHFQPKIVLASGACRSAEALIRWQHPTRGFVPPDQFIAFAEQTGFVRQLTRWVLARACAQLADWRRQGHALSLNVNISTRDLIHQDLAGLVDHCLREHALPAAALCLEITESAIMDDPTAALASLHSLHAMGVRLSIDDFGTGYSSLAYLRKLPVQELKIDRSFVLGLAAEAGDEAIVRSTIELAHNMGLKVVAEGVETEAVSQRLRALGCDEAQGYFFSRPLAAEAFAAWLAARAAPLPAPAIG